MLDDQPAAGFIGLGSMGASLARRLLRGGAKLHVYDVDRAAVDRLVAAGAVAHASPREVADHAELVIGCLPSGAICREVVLNASEGVVAGSRAAVYVECSTIGREAVLGLAQGLAAGARRIGFVDAPVSGGPKGADAGTLAVMASGSHDSLQRALPFLREFGKTVYEVGAEPGMAQMMKLVNNLISATNMASAFEAFVLGTKAGLDPNTMVEVVNASTGRNSATETKIPMSILPGTFDYGARVDVIYKDVQLGLAEAEALDVPMWVGQNTAQVWRHAMSQGRAAEDFTSLIKVMEEWAGVQVRSRAPGQ